MPTHDEIVAIFNKAIEEKYDEMYFELGYETIEEMKENYTKSEVRKAVLLDKVQKFVFDNSNIKKTFTIPNK